MSKVVKKYHPFALSLLALQISFAHGGSLPEDGQISLGSGSISQSGNRLTVQQNSDKLSVNWQSFNIGAGKSVVFEQPSSSSIALNRVLGSSRSEIYGSLQANGRVFLINPNGVLFGPTAEVNVGGLVATTKQLADADFAADHFQFTHSGQLGEVVNQGNLKAIDGGFIVLAADTVKNQGTITATRGHAVLAAGETVNLNLDATGKLLVAVDGEQLQALVNQQGLIAADGGQVLLTAQGREMLQTSAINLEGIVRAQSIAEHNGRITIGGGDGTVVASNLELDATGLDAGERGGEITITGRNISLKRSTNIDAQGLNGGGNVLIGGEFQGQGDLPTAETLTVSNDSRINASATENGDGGTVVLWSDQQTDFYGGIKSRGGAQAGDGGIVEVSGKEQLNYQAAEATDTRATNGSWGTLWLDPANINITDGTGGNNSGTANSSGGNITDGQLITELGSTGVNLIADTITDDGAGVNVTTGSGGALTLTATTGAGTINLGGNYSVNGGLVFNHTGSSTLSGVIGGAGSLTKEGSGTAILTGNSTYTGTTTINSGILQIGTGGSTGRIGSGAVTIGSSGTLRHFRAGVWPSQPTFANNVSGSGNFILSGGIADITGNWTSFAGTTTVDAGARYRTGNNNATSGAAHWVINGIMSLDSTNGVTLTLGSLSGSGSIFAGGGFTSMPVIVGGRNEDSTFSGSMSSGPGGSGNGVSSLTKVGTGTLTLTGNSTTRWAPIIVSSGTLAVGDAGMLSSTGNQSNNISIASGATFEYGSSVDQILSGVISGAGQFTKSGTGNLILTGTNTHSGTISINSGRLQVGDGGTTGTLGTGSVTIGTDGTFRHFRTDAFSSRRTITNTFLGTGNFVLSGTQTNITGNMSGFAGTVTIDAGARYRAGNNNATSNSANWVVNGALSLDENNGDTLTLGSLSGSGEIFGGSANSLMPVIAGALNTDTTFSGTLYNLTNGVSSFTKEGTGTLTLTGSGTGHGPREITVSEGTLAIGSAGNLTSLSQSTGTYTSNISIASGATFEYGSSVDQTISGTITGAGNLTKSGTGTLTLTGLTGTTGNYNGTTTVNEGTLKFVDPGVLGEGATIIASGAVLEVNSNNGILGNQHMSNSLSFSGGGTYRKTGSGHWSMGRSNTGTISFDSGALIDVQEGVLYLGFGNVHDWSNNKADLNVASGTIFDIWTSNVVVNNLSGDGVIANGDSIIDQDKTFTIGVDNGNSTFSGLIRDGLNGGVISLIKAGAGTQTLTGNNTYSGTTTINNGTLQIGNGSTTGTLGSGVVTNNGHLIFDRSDTVALSSLASNAAGISGSGDLTARIGGGFTVDRAINLNGASSNIILGAGVNNLAGDGSGGNLTISSPVTTSAGGSLTLFSGTPDTANLVSQLNGATGATQYKTYNSGLSDISSATAGTRNLFYRTAPTLLSLSLSGVDKAYDGTQSASPLPANYNASGSTPIDGDGNLWTPNTSGSGYSAVYDSSAVGNRVVSVNNVSFDTTDTTNGNFVVRGYQPSSALINGSGTITPASISVAISANNKRYDGTTAATLNLDNAVLTGLIPGDNLIISQAQGQFDTALPGTGKQVSISGIVLSGADLGNYQLLSTSATTFADIISTGNNQSSSATAIAAALGQRSSATPPADAALVAVAQSSSSTPPSQEVGNTSAQSEGDQGRVSVAESPASNLLADTSRGVEPSIACGQGIALPAGVAGQPVASCQK